MIVHFSFYFLKVCLCLVLISLFYNCIYCVILHPVGWFYFALILVLKCGRTVRCILCMKQINKLLGLYFQRCKQHIKIYRSEKVELNTVSVFALSWQRALLLMAEGK